MFFALEPCGELVAKAVLRGARAALERIAHSLAAAVRRREAAEQAKAAREAELKVVRGQVRELSSILEDVARPRRREVHGFDGERQAFRIRAAQARLAQDRRAHPHRHAAAPAANNVPTSV